MLTEIKHGDNGDLVRVAQLLTRYSERDQATGQFNADFVAFMASWQGAHDCVPDGIIGSKTWRAIADSAPTCSTTKNKTSGETQALQILIGQEDVIADGIFGKKTKEAVASYQAASGLDSDGVCGKKTWHCLICGDGEAPSHTPGEFKRPVNYKQHDPRWGSKVYTKNTMAKAGCGPTAAADIIATLVDPSATPWALAQLSKKWKTNTSGTEESFFPKVGKYYKFKKVVTTSKLSGLKACLDAGGYAVAHMGAGYWTSQGHYICVWKYDSKYIYANDPSSPSSKRKTERKKQDSTQFMKELKGNFFCFYPQIESSSDQKPSDQKTDKVIVDISKHNGDIDFNKLKDEVSLVIARCSCGSDLDAKFDDYAEKMNALEIPFGVYCYSYARDKEKAVDEAKKMVFYASKYNPIFFVIDAEEACITRDTILTFKEELKKLGVKKIGCYVAHEKYDKFKYAEIADQFDFTWIPRYGFNTGRLEDSKRPEYFCDLWQYTDEGRIAGINGDADLNVLTNEGHDLTWFLSR